jgi:hypothetical protein
VVADRVRDWMADRRTSPYRRPTIRPLCRWEIVELARRLEWRSAIRTTGNG